jgi:alkylhydroperoxidase family enzyme
LLIMRIAWLAGSEYEWAQHWDVAIGSGIAPDDIVAVRDWKKSDRLTAADRAVLAAVDDSLLHGGISDDAWRSCTEHVGGRAELVELVVAIGHWSAFTQLFRSFGLPLEAGASLWPPDGVGPPSLSRP